MIAMSSWRCSTYSALRAVATNYQGITSSFRGETIRRRSYSNGGPSDGRRMNVFDRKAKRWHKNRASMSPDADTFDYLRDEVTLNVGHDDLYRMLSMSRDDLYHITFGPTSNQDIKQLC